MPKKKLADARTEADKARWFEQTQSRLLKMPEKEGALRIGGKSVHITIQSVRDPGIVIVNGNKRLATGSAIKRIHQDTITRRTGARSVSGNRACLGSWYSWYPSCIGKDICRETTKGVAYKCAKAT